MAIMSIMLHNFIHLDKFGFARENEMEYHLSRTQVFFDHIINANSILSVMGDIISFVGWFGVPVFVFFSGYGLATKYGDKFASNFDKKDYLKHSYLKLLLLILPAAIFFILFRAAIGDWQRIVEILFSFTFLNSLFSGIIIKLHYAAPPFWYFSLTFQLYIIWLLLRNLSNRRLVIVGGGISFVSNDIQSRVFWSETYQLHAL